MKYQALREEVCRANRDIVAAGLVVLTWGNASGADRGEGVMAIKPSGIEYQALRSEDIVVLSLASGEVRGGDLRPSSDTPTHLHLYRHFDGVGGVAHTHSTYATCWAQAGREIPCLGTTHADHFHGPVPVARELDEEEIRRDYEHHTGVAIVDRFRHGGLRPDHVPGILVPGHGPFTWGATLAQALENAIALEEVARTALHTRQIRPDAPALAPALLDKHFLRKHGDDAYYGQTPAQQDS